MGGNPYETWVSAEKFDVGDCACYLGRKDELCKHLVALAIRARGGRQAAFRERKNDAECAGAQRDNGEPHDRTELERLRRARFLRR